jgi:putative endonuclease
MAELRRQQAELQGRRAEQFTLWLYRLAGWRLLAQRKRTSYGEIDLIMARFHTLLFIEVKWRARQLTAEEMLPGPAQQHRLLRAMTAELAQQSARRGRALQGRFDLICWAGWRPVLWLRQVGLEGRGGEIGT